MQNDFKTVKSDRKHTLTLMAKRRKQEEEDEHSGRDKTRNWLSRSGLVRNKGYDVVPSCSQCLNGI